jgi:hypothetical protein
MLASWLDGRRAGRLRALAGLVLWLASSADGQNEGTPIAPNGAAVRLQFAVPPPALYSVQGPLSSNGSFLYVTAVTTVGTGLASSLEVPAQQRVEPAYDVQLAAFLDTKASNRQVPRLRGCTRLGER